MSAQAAFGMAAFVVLAGIVVEQIVVFINDALRNRRVRKEHERLYLRNQERR